MKINVKTYIETDKPLREVFQLFNKEMFYELTKNAPVTPLRYDGDFVGAEIHIEMLLPWKDKFPKGLIRESLTERLDGSVVSYCTLMNIVNRNKTFVVE